MIDIKAIRAAAELSKRWGAPVDPSTVLAMCDEIENQAGLIKALEAQVANQQKHLLRQDAELERLRKDAERYRWLSVNAYVGIAPHPKPHEVWCLRLPNPSDCNNLDAAIDAAMESK